MLFRSDVQLTIFCYRPPSTGPYRLLGREYGSDQDDCEDKGEEKCEITGGVLAALADAREAIDRAGGQFDARPLLAAAEKVSTVPISHHSVILQSRSDCDPRARTEVGSAKILIVCSLRCRSRNPKWIDWNTLHTSHR